MSRKTKKIKKRELAEKLDKVEEDFLLELEVKKQKAENEIAKKKKDAEEYRENIQKEIDEKYQEALKYKEKYKKEVDIENDLIKNEFEEYKKNALEDFDNYYKELEEYEELLKIEYSERERNLILNLAREKQILIDKYRSDKEGLEKYKIALEEDLDKEINDLNKYELELKQMYLDELTKSNEQLDVLKNDFETYMEQRELDFINKMKEKEEKLSNKSQAQTKKYKLIELDLLKKEKEIEEKAGILNERITDFTDTKRKFIKRHYILHIIYNKIKNNLKKFIVLYLLVIFAFIYLFYSFEYTVSKKTFISDAMTKYLREPNTEVNYLITLDTSQAVLKNFTDLDNLTLKLKLSKNKNFLEHYKQKTLSHNDEDFKWERFYKNQTMIMKSAFDGQYILTEDYNDFDFIFNPNEENKIVLNSIREYLSSLKNKDFTSVNRINVLGKDNFLEYIKNSLIISKNYNYFYKIEKPSQELFDNIFIGLINSDNYNSFLREEQEIQKALSLTDYLSDTKRLLFNIITYSKVVDIDTKVQIREGNILETIDILFSLEYQDETMVNPVPITIRLNCDYKEINPDVSLEKDKFTLNAVDLMRLSPREEKKEFKEIESIPFEEQSSTLEELLKKTEEEVD